MEGDLYKASKRGEADKVFSILNDPNYRNAINLQWQFDGNDIGDTTLTIACLKGQVKIVEMLLNHPTIDPNFNSRKGFSPLFCASQEGHIDIIRLLLKHPKIDVNQGSKYYFQNVTALSIAAFERRIAAVRVLLQRDDIDINKKNKDGGTPLLAARLNGDYNMVRLLLASGRKIEIGDYKDQNEDIKNLIAAYKQNPKLWSKVLNDFRQDIQEKDNEIAKLKEAQTKET